MSHLMLSELGFAGEGSLAFDAGEARPIKAGMLLFVVLVQRRLGREILAAYFAPAQENEQINVWKRIG